MRARGPASAGSTGGPGGGNPSVTWKEVSCQMQIGPHEGPSGATASGCGIGPSRIRSAPLRTRLRAGLIPEQSLEDLPRRRLREGVDEADLARRLVDRHLGAAP